MSSGFKFGGAVYWGTNGAIELCLDRMIETDARQPGDDSVAVFLRNWREMFFMGTVVDLDEILEPPMARARFVELLGAAITTMSAENGGLSDHGRQWLDSVLRELHAVLVASLPSLR